MAIGPLLKSTGIIFKAPASLDILMRINAGIAYGYSQIGKFITIYPRDESDFLGLVEKLEPLLTKWSANPAVPFDLRFEKTCIYYRFGAFRANFARAGIGETSCITSPDGIEIDDLRNVLPTEIGWLKDPFAAPPANGCRPKLRRKNKLNTQYVVNGVLSQRGKGGVYECLDLRQDPPRRCILKEGRKNGETMWDGRDARARIRNEAKVLRLLAKTTARVPRVFDNFRLDGNEYLVLERIEGVDLRTFIEQGRRQLPIRDLLKICLEICQIIASIHKANLIWRDCKPSNLIIDINGCVRPLDFEGACSAKRPDPLPWSTRHFMSPEMATSGISGSADRRQDLFALGVSLFQLLEGRMPVADKEQKWDIVARRGVPRAVKFLIAQLLSQDPLQRPEAETACAIVGQAISKPSKTRIETPLVQTHSIQ